MLIRYKMNCLSIFQELLLDPGEKIPADEMEKWSCIEDVDFSFNSLEGIDETVVFSKQFLVHSDISYS